MTAIDDVDALLECYKLATAEFIKGNPEPYKMLFSHREDVTLANPFFPVVRGWNEVSEVLERTASRLRDGEFLGSEIVAKYVTPELAYIVEIERTKAKVGEREDVAPIALRATMIRPEEGTWKVVHRHADTIITAQPARAMIQQKFIPGG